VPAESRRLVNCLRVRWALDEAGLPHRVKLPGPGANAHPDDRAWQPFGRVSAYHDSAVTLLETGAILLRIADLASLLAGVLRPPGARGPVAARPVLAACLAHCVARPAFARAGGADDGFRGGTGAGSMGREGLAFPALSP
jgi:glutathione S-transferase